jgi:hypothetical protein
MFKLILQDRKGNILNEKDIVKVSNGKTFTFYSEVKYIDKKGVLAPFHTFSFHSFEKVDKVPDGAILADELDYNIWYVPNAEPDEYAKDFNKYLMSWRECEIAIEKSAFVIKRNNELF